MCVDEGFWGIYLGIIMSSEFTSFSCVSIFTHALLNLVKIPHKSQFERLHGAEKGEK